MSFFQNNERFSNFLHAAMAAPFGLMAFGIALKLVVLLV
jgi:hypothetical protein